MADKQFSESRMVEAGDPSLETMTGALATGLQVGTNKPAAITADS